jgi:hypothetical protein
VPGEANLLPAYGSFADLEEACGLFCGRVNGRVHRETAAIPADQLTAEREHLHPLPAEPYALALSEERLVAEDQSGRGSARTARCYSPAATTLLVCGCRTRRAQVRSRPVIPGSRRRRASWTIPCLRFRMRDDSAHLGAVRTGEIRPSLIWPSGRTSFSVPDRPLTRSCTTPGAPGCN